MIPPTAAPAHSGPTVTGLRAPAPVTVAKVTGLSQDSKTPSASPSPTPTAQVKQTPAAAPTASGTDPLWDHNAKTWLTDIVLLMLLAFGFALITWWRLLKMGPVKRR